MDAVGAAVNAVYASQIFLAPCVAVAMMCQVFVGRWQGAREWTHIGPGVWQFIWFSLLSAALTVPCGLLYGHLYFQSSELQDVVFPYYTFLLVISFLYPLGAALTSFYLGLGKTFLVLSANIGFQILRVLLCYSFIFGIEGWITPFGIYGGPISSLIAQSGFCLLLMVVFLQKKYHEIYRSRDWHFKFKLFSDCLSPCTLRGINRLLCFASWASIAHLISSKGGDYLIVLSIGGTVFLLLPFLAEAICEAQITVVSQILGNKDYHLLNRAFISGTVLVMIIVAIFAIPLLIFPTEILHQLFPGVLFDDVTTHRIFFGMWVSFALFTFVYVPIAHVLSFKDTRFSMFMGAFNWINGFLLMYVMIEMWGISPDNFWLALSLMHGSTAFLYVWRMKALQAPFIASHKLILTAEA